MNWITAQSRYSAWSQYLVTKNCYPWGVQQQHSSQTCPRLKGELVGCVTSGLGKGTCSLGLHVGWAGVEESESWLIVCYRTWFVGCHIVHFSVQLPQIHLHNFIWNDQQLSEENFSPSTCMAVADSLHLLLEKLKLHQVQWFPCTVIQRWSILLLIVELKHIA